VVKPAFSPAGKRGRIDSRFPPSFQPVILKTLRGWLRRVFDPPGGDFTRRSLTAGFKLETAVAALDNAKKRYIQGPLFQKERTNLFQGGIV
jgi:hypothetical protein